MKISYEWLQTFFEEKLPSIEKLSEIFTFHSFEVEEIIPAGRDTVLDLDITPNRAHDCLSHRGVAKELAALLGIEMKRDPLKEYSGKLSEFLISLPSCRVSVKVEDNKLSSRYSAVVIKNVSVESSPEWLKNRLYSLGQQSINNIVDLTNYVMFETGQPLHAFDLDKLSKDKEGCSSISVRRAKKGERMITLDGDEYTFEEGELLISDGVSDEPLGIAGVKGGKRAEIDENTQNIVLESANFNPVNIRATSKRLGLRTEASVRFEYGITPALTECGLLETAELIKSLAGGEVEGYKDFYPRPANRYYTGVSIERINSLLGVELDRLEVEEIFNRLGFSYSLIDPICEISKEAQKYIGTPYKYGASVSYDAPQIFDCSGFVSFIFSRLGIQIPRMSVDQYVFGEEVSKEDISVGDLVFVNTKKEVEGPVRYESVEFMAGTKITEGVDYSAIYLGEGKIIHSSRKKGGVIVEDLEESDIAGSVVGYRRVIEAGRRFVVVAPDERIDVRIEEDLIEEIGRIYGYKNIEVKIPEVGEYNPCVLANYYFRERICDVLKELGFSEVKTYVFKNSGEVETLNPIASDKAFLRDNIKSGLIDALELNSRNAELLALDQIKVFEIGKVFEAQGEKEMIGIGVKDIKKLKSDKKAKAVLECTLKEIEERFGVEFASKVEDKKGDGKLCILEEDFGKLAQGLKVPKDYSELADVSIEESFNPISPYPYVLRDIAVWMPEESSSCDLLSVLLENGGGLLVNYKLFDEYHKEESVSYAFRLVFQSKDKTLSDSEVNVVMDNIYKAVEQKGWQAR